MTGSNDAAHDGTEAELCAALDDEDPETAVERTKKLWQDRDVTDVEVLDGGDGGTVEVHKGGFSAMFSVTHDPRSGSRASEKGWATYERHDEQGYYLLEDVEVYADLDVETRMNEALEAVVEAHNERRRARREYYRNAL
jgi:hypothetical protein